MRLMIALLMMVAAGPALACGPDSDCKVGERTYRLYVPADAGQPMGALFYAHGYRGSAAGAMRNKALRRLADDLGMALVALKSRGDDWNLAHRPSAPQQGEAAEFAYVAAVLRDLASHMHLDSTKLVFSGFSAGGMMTWTMACGMSESFAGFVPMSGTFWAPVPQSCPTPAANLVHLHGTQDGTVPLTGRTIGPARQGDVHRALAMYAAHGNFTETAQGVPAPDGMRCTQSRNPGGKLLEFCTFDGGHGFSTRRLRHGVERVLGGS
ncbi:alpha/beta hydrolase family esterase [Oceaniglobus trochenteri]|uniref:alpha/beta hydrolase family esterase n=1 Tax=Oceaniglobus trochenteri TaxID=2763260 RepID=UPI001CFFC69F|nr:PHB depolymerase family esterase [Oceaniglobus trochenteri]